MLQGALCYQWKTLAFPQTACTYEPGPDNNNKVIIRSQHSSKIFHLFQSKGVTLSSIREDNNRQQQ